ncbi:hypothetical protein H2200_005233 [Cladophialophora chaetospira]|uniref:Uncharacterized protein n=1 Tax=Cladophialophora chaetospira TaxID=386627 RepID=A0AA39CJM4_9EURO|nr:hypothetical protein H2200_005233 [Cladophialophora chaetospira]
MEKQLSPDEVSALRHWSTFGQKGEPPAQRVTSKDQKTKPIEKPATAAWDQLIPHPEIPKLLLGFQPRAMEDKWFVYTDGPDAQGNGVVHMFRSWTGMKMIEARFTVRLDDDGEVAKQDARFTELVWETAHGLTEDEAVDMARGVCEWCMGMRMSSSLRKGEVSASGEERVVDAQV